MKISTRARNAMFLGVLCSLSYFAVYIARNILGAVTPKMTAESFSLDYIGELAAVYLLAYACGQLINGSIGDFIKAKYMISIGLLSRGIVSLGLLSLGILSFGLLSLGLIALGVFSLGAVAAGSVALGLLAAGAIAVGVMSFGALSVGCFSVGALAVGQYAAVGDHAYACVAIGKSFAEGSAYSHIGDVSTADIAAAVSWLDANVPPYLAWAKTIFTFFIR